MNIDLVVKIFDNVVKLFDNQVKCSVQGGVFFDRNRPDEVRILAKRSEFRVLLKLL